MYNYTYDTDTGGLLLNTSPMQFSKEPRPVYYRELDLLGFDQYWTYEKQDALPYMWAEANKYYYFGRLVAQTRGGNLYTAPEIQVPALACDTTLLKAEWKTVFITPQSKMLHNVDIEGNGIIYTYNLPEPDGSPLKAVDIKGMLEKNADFLQVLEQETVKKIYDVWKRHRSKVDVFHVAFSGGKDSIVLLDLVKKALPKDEFVVVFGDTQMEFPDTYDVVDKVETQCKAEGISFYRAKSHMDALESWRTFGPPSRVLRWCCSVHKSTPQVIALRNTPQVIKLRETLDKADYSGLAFVGVRGAESMRRNEYDYECDGKKQKGKYSANPILDWTSDEIWLYIYANNLVINEAYKKGSQRVGCLCCPMGGSKADYVQYRNYQKEVDAFAQIIMESNGRTHISDTDYISNGGWNARKNGVNIRNIDINYKERIENNRLIIEVTNPKSDWQEWVKTLGQVQMDENFYIIHAHELVTTFSFFPRIHGYVVHLPLEATRTSPVFGKYFRQVFRKAAYCVACRTCEVNCRNNCISFEKGFKIENCSKCRECHTIPLGCLTYHSLKMPQGDGKVKSINCFATHMPKTEWFADFFDRKNEFLTDNNLGPVQKPFFRRFLRDAALIEDGQITFLTEKLALMPWDNTTSLGIILANIAYNPQFTWYIRRMNICHFYTRRDLTSMLEEFGVTEKNTPYIINGFKRIVQTPFGMTLNFGYVDSEENYIRNKCHIENPLVVLYSLYKFAEACGDYYEFTVSRLLNYSIDSDGISPSQIFGIEEDDLKTILQGLTASNGDFITAKFTHDLETISLNRNKKASDVLELL
jgi:phosphoadenosine phosphosulfate reductase